MIILVRALNTHGGWAHRQRVSTTLKAFLVLLTGLELGPMHGISTRVPRRANSAAPPPPILTTLVLQILCWHSPSMLVVHWSVSLSHVTWGVSSALYMKSSSHVTSPIVDSLSISHDVMLALATLGASDFLHANTLRSKQEEKYYQ